MDRIPAAQSCVPSNPGSLRTHKLRRCNGKLVNPDGRRGDGCVRANSQMNMGRRVVGAGLLLIWVAACGTPWRDHTRGPIKGTLAADNLERGAPTPPPYKIQRGDSLAIRFYRNPELNID